jgi:tetratricopeptide (TPR) repeat protein
MTGPATGPASGWRPGLPLLLAAAFVAAALLLTLGNGLVWDDELLVKSARGLGDPDFLWSYLSRPLWQNADYVVHKLHDYWRPATSFLLWLTAFAFGRWPPAFHGLSIVVALGAAAALYLLARTARPRGARLPAAGLALLFLAHPLAAEVVCMAANISDHLAFAFLALAVVLLVRRLRGTASGPLICLAAGALVFLACASKELGIIGVAAPLAAWLIERAGGSGTPARRLLEPGPWIGAALAAALYLVLRHLATTTTHHEPTQLPALGFYARSVFFGLGQAARHLLAPVPAGAHVYLDTAAAGPVLTASAAWLGLAAVIAWRLRRDRALGLPVLGLLLALALLLPSLLAVDVQVTSLRFPTRYFHLPLAGLLLAILPAADRLWERGVRFAVPPAAALLALLSLMRVGEWEDDIAFFSAEARYHPDSPPDLHNLARAMVNARAYTEAEILIGRIDALPMAREPSFQAVLMNDKATIRFLRDRDLDGASEMLRRALTWKPDDLANVLDLAAMRVSAGRPDQAVIILKKALEAPWFRDYRRPAIERRLARYERLAAEAGSAGAEGAP